MDDQRKKLGQKKKDFRSFQNFKLNIKLRYTLSFSLDIRKNT